MQEFLLSVVGYLFIAITIVASILGKATCLAIFDSVLK
jgi:hypothetical protein